MIKTVRLAARGYSSPPRGESVTTDDEGRLSQPEVDQRASAALVVASIIDIHLILTATF